jgi:hypothetical protein
MSRVPLRGLVLTACCLLLPLAAGAARAAEDNPLEGLKVNGEAFIDWSHSYGQSATTDAFTLQRAYVTVTKKASTWLSFRYTLDVKSASTDKPADGSVASSLDGNYIYRTKFAFAEMALGSAGWLSDVRGRVGMQHVGPDDFEQGMNPYRCQDKFWVERSGIFGTSDLGVGLNGSFGGKLEDAKGKTGSTKFDGRYGGFALALTNGSGYDKAEKNTNKVFTSRVSLRPFAAAIPGLQATYAGALGKDNTTDGAALAAAGPGNDFHFHLAMLSWQSPQATVYGQYMTFRGNQAGKYVYGSGLAREGLAGRSWSVFGMVRLPAADSPFAFFARYNTVDPDIGHDIITADQGDRITDVTAGYSYEVARGNMFVLAFDMASYDANASALGSAPGASATNRPDDKRVQVIYRLEF